MTDFGSLGFFVIAASTSMYSMLPVSSFRAADAHQDRSDRCRGDDIHLASLPRGRSQCLPDRAGPNARGRRCEADQSGRTRLASERTRHVNRIRGLLALHGIRSIKSLWGGRWRAQLDILETGDGRPLGRYIKAEITREFKRLHLVLDQIKALEAERRDALLDPASPFPDRAKVAS